MIRSGCGAKRLLGRTEQSRQASAEKAGAHAAIWSNSMGVVSSTTGERLCARSKEQRGAKTDWSADPLQDADPSVVIQSQRWRGWISGQWQALFWRVRRSWRHEQHSRCNYDRLLQREIAKGGGDWGALWDVRELPAFAGSASPRWPDHRCNSCSRSKATQYAQGKRRHQSRASSKGLGSKSDRLQQKDLDARWVKKNGVNHYGYKNSICIDVDQGFIRRYAVTPANIHDSQMLPHLLDPENEHDNVWADSAYSGERFEKLLSLGGFESLIHKKGARYKPLSNTAKDLNRIKSAIRSRVEHVFGCMTMSMGGKMTRTIGLARTEMWWGLKNLTFNFVRYLQCTPNLATTAAYWSKTWQSLCRFNHVVERLCITARFLWWLINAVWTYWCSIFRGAL